MRALRNGVYYTLKPWLSSGFRLALRRWHARRQRARFGDVWPILPGSERQPAGWTGWPEGKQFALVLTHDVEGPLGLTRCRQLMDLERKLGFRSSFNFIPEGPYEVPAEVRFELEGSGFEVGVHDLHHDGKLFRSSTGFSKRAERINHYLTRWGAVGFRAGFMLHNLDWTQQLNILYEASTFDTDPFEPQPEGVGTIFPFWVPASAQVAHSRRQKAQTCGFVELPYTLVQDSTLYLLLEETSPDIWFKKLDWIAQHGGMALLNVHPDYVRFNGDSPSALTYPARFYEQFLEYALNKYKGCFWQPLPREVAAFVAVHRVALPSKSRRICMVSYSPFLSDARVSRYAEALAQRGDRVDVLALRASPQQPVEDKIGNITVFYFLSRYRMSHRLGLLHLFPILRSFLKSFF